MADRRPPGFNIPLGFYDGPEVESIPRRIRAAAVGVWALCGTFSANKLQDGYVGPKMMRQLGCTDAISAALKATLGPDGDHDPLWVDARGGGIQFTKWVKYQRSRVEVKAYREADAERKRREREAQSNSAEPDPNSEDVEMSGRTRAGRPQFVPPESQTPKTETKTETDCSYVRDDGYPSNAQAVAVEPPEHIDNPARPAKRHPSSAALTVVRHELGNAGYPQTTLKRLAVQAEKLYHEGGIDALIREALRDWDRREDCTRPEYLATVYGDIVKRSRATPGTNGKPHKMRGLAELTQAERAIEQLQAAKELT